MPRTDLEAKFDFFTPTPAERVRYRADIRTPPGCRSDPNGCRSSKLSCRGPHAACVTLTDRTCALLVRGYPPLITGLSERQDRKVPGPESHEHTRAPNLTNREVAGRSWMLCWGPAAPGESAPPTCRLDMKLACGASAMRKKAGGHGNSRACTSARPNLMPPSPFRHLRNEW